MVTRGSVVNAAYYGGDAVKHAEMWYGGFNTDKYYKASLDCTNFVVRLHKQYKLYICVCISF